MVTISMLVLGVIATKRIPLQFLPNVDPAFLAVTIPYPGATPAQVEQQIAIPVEGEFRTVSGLENIRTISNGEGCFVSMMFTADTEMGLAAAEVRDRIERLKLVLPDDVDQMLIERFNSRSIPIMAFGLFRPDGDAAFVDLLRRSLEPRLRRIDGVADVQLRSSSPEREVIIEFEQDHLRNLNIGLFDVILQLRQSSLNTSVGELIDGDRKHIVRVVGEYSRLDELGALVVSANGTRLSDVAHLRFGAREETSHVSLDGQGGALVLITKESEANAVSTCRLVREEMEKILVEQDFAGVGQKIFFDQSDYITGALQSLMKEGIYGGLLALVILFIFLHRLLPTLVVALMIPTSLVFALVFMYFWGMTLNMITMVSLIIVVGMLVDNAIVVVENIIRHRQLGKSSWDAALIGSQEVGPAILAATVTTWVVFIPMYYMDSGTMSVFMEELGLPLNVAVGGSLVMALTVVPLALSRIEIAGETNFFTNMAHWFRRGHVHDKPSTGMLAGMGRLRIVERTIYVYSGMLRWSLKNRLAVMVMLGVAAAITIAVPTQRVGMGGMPQLDTREIEIQIELDQSYDMARATNLFSSMQAQLDARREELDIKNVMTFYGAAGGSFNVYLYSEEDGERGINPKYTTDQTTRILSKLLGTQMPGAEIDYNIADASASGEGQTVTMYVYGDERGQLETHARDFRARLDDLAEVSDVQTDLERASNEIQIQIDEPLAHQYGITAQSIALTADAAMRGARLPYMKQGIREIPVWVQFREEDRKSRANLEKVAVAGATGALVPLSRLVEFPKERTAATIQRYNGKNVISISAKADTEDLVAVRNALSNAINNFKLPTGYHIDFGDTLREVGADMSNFISAMIMATILVYIVMSAIFESVFFPLSILTTVPLSLAGAVWMLYFTGSQFDSVTLIGCILMVGVIVDNGIVIVDHINHLRKESDDFDECIVQAGADRYRPVMMTALCTILGLVPMAMATTGSGATFAGLGRALIGGLSLGTLLTLIVVPVFYSLIEEFQTWCGRFLGSIVAGRTKVAAPPAE